MDLGSRKDPYLWTKEDFVDLSHATDLAQDDRDMWTFVANNICDGEVLLTSVDYAALKLFMGLDVFSTATKIIKTIRELRKRSALYASAEGGSILHNRAIQYHPELIVPFEEIFVGDPVLEGDSHLLLGPSTSSSNAKQPIEEAPRGTNVVPENDTTLSQISFFKESVNESSRDIDFGPFVLDDADEVRSAQSDVASSEPLADLPLPTLSSDKQAWRQGLSIGGPSGSINIQDCFQTDDSSSELEICFSSAIADTYNLQRSYTQRRLLFAFLQDYTVDRTPKGLNLSWPLYWKPESEEYLRFVAATNKADPYLEWSTLSNRQSELTLSSWFDKIDWEQRLAAYAIHEDNDPELPPFGESGDEGCYPSDVMDDMDLEEEEQTKAIGLNKEPITEDEVRRILTALIDKFATDWEACGLKRLERRSRKLWQVFHDLRSAGRRARRDQIELESGQTTDRKRKIWQSLLGAIYHSERTVKYQAESLRETIYQEREQLYLLALYDEKAECPPRATKLARLTSGHEAAILHSDRTSESQISSDSFSAETEDSAYMYEDPDIPILDIVSDSDDDYEDENMSSVSDSITHISISSSSASRDTMELSVRSRTRPESSPSSDSKGIPRVSTDQARSGKIMVPDSDLLVRKLSEDMSDEPMAIQSHQIRKRHQEKGSKEQASVEPTVLHNPDTCDGPAGELKNAKEVMDDSRGIVFKMINDSDEDPGMAAEYLLQRSKDRHSPGRKRTKSKLADYMKRPSQQSSEGRPLKRQIDSASESDNAADEVQISNTDNSPRKSKQPRKRKKRKRSVNQQAAARRIQQQLEREEIAERAHMQILSPRDGTAVSINPGDDQIDEVIFIDSALANVLKPHQLEGCRFLWRETIMMSQVGGCLLAHTMGLGKTLQVITYLHTLGRTIATAKNLVPKALRRPHAMILCPASLINNWINELHYWTPNNALGHVFDPSRDTRNDFRLETLFEWRDEGGILILSYNMFTQMLNKKRKMFDDDEKAATMCSLLTGTPRIVIADEAHHFKNANTDVGRAVRQLRTKVRIALTGSPLANNLLEYWTIIDWIDEGYLGSKSDFQAEYVQTIENGNRSDATKSEIRQGQKRLKILLGIIGGKINRRNLECLRSLLPGKFEYVLFLRFTQVQKSLYNSFIDAISDSKIRGPKKLLSLISRLKWICNYPGLIRPENTLSVQHKAAKRRSDKALETNDIVDSNDVEIDEYREETETEQWRKKAVLLYGSTLDPVETSSKLLILLEICRAAKALGDKVLVFSFSIPTIEALKIILSEHLHVPVRVISGSKRAKTRVSDVTDFNNMDGFGICLVSTKAGGQGLNIAGANRVVLFDHEFNPIWAEQAVGRAYRMGQKKDVYVYRLQVDGSFENRLFQQALRKLGLTSKVVDEKNVQTQVKNHENLLDYFRAAPEVDRMPDPVGELEDKLLKDVLKACPNQVISVDKTESFHIEEVNELDATDMLEISAAKEAYWKEQERKQLQAELAAKMSISQPDTAMSQTRLPLVLQCSKCGMTNIPSSQEPSLVGGVNLCPQCISAGKSAHPVQTLIGGHPVSSLPGDNPIQSSSGDHTVQSSSGHHLAQNAAGDYPLQSLIGGPSTEKQFGRCQTCGEERVRVWRHGKPVCNVCRLRQAHEPTVVSQNSDLHQPLALTLPLEEESEIGFQEYLASTNE